MTRAANDNTVAHTATIHLGDCFAIMPTLPKVDLVITSPPYCDIGMEYGDNFEGIDNYVEFSRRWIKAAADTLSDDGAMWINVGHYKASKWSRIPLTYYLFPLFAELGLTMVQEVVWDRRRHLATTTRFSTRSERWVWLVKNPKKYTFHLDEVRVPTRQIDKRNNPLGANPSDVWEFAPVQTAQHPCAFPMAMIERIVMACSDEGQLVLDPFGGSGTTAIAALKHNRCAILIERDAGYFAICEERIIGRKAAA
jgi:adenine-specific DNA-methyltransferase